MALPVAQFQLKFKILLQLAVAEGLRWTAEQEERGIRGQAVVSKEVFTMGYPVGNLLKQETPMLLVNLAVQTTGMEGEVVVTKSLGIKNGLVAVEEGMVLPVVTECPKAPQLQELEVVPTEHRI